LILIWNQFYKIVPKQKHWTVCIYSTQHRKLKTDCHKIVISQNPFTFYNVFLTLLFETPEDEHFLIETYSIQKNNKGLCLSEIIFVHVLYCVQRYVISLLVNVQYVCSYNWTFCLFSALFCRTLSRYVKLMSVPVFRYTMWWSALSTLLYPIFNRNVKLERTAEL
jgi:hypothetical protein